MHPRIAELTEYLAQNRLDLAAAVREVPASQIAQRPAPDRWSTVEVIEHLGIVERRIADRSLAGLIKEKVQGLALEHDASPVLPTTGFERVLDRTQRVSSPETGQPTGKLSADEAWAALEGAHGALSDLLAAADGFALTAVVYPHPLFGPLNLYQWIAFTGAHMRRHAEQIRENAAALKAS